MTAKRSYDVLIYLPSVTPLLGGGSGRPAGGAETQIVLLARALARRRVGVCVVAFPSEDGVRLSLEGVDILVRPVHKAHQPLVGKLHEVATIGRAVAQVDARVVVARVAGPQVGLVALAAKLLRRKFVYSSANIVDFDFPALGFRRRDLVLYRLGIRLADEIVVQTEEQAELCRERFRKPCVVIKSIAEPAEGIGEPEALLWIGRLVWYKQPLAFVELARALPDVPFRMLVVPTPEGGSVPDEVRRAAAGVPNLELLEPRPRSSVLNLIARAAAVVNTSDYEGMPNIFLEGWSRGVPALALSHDPDGVIERHRLGEFACGSHERLVTGARKLWEGRHDAAELAERCRAYVVAEHSEDAVAVRWAQALGVVVRLETPVDLREVAEC